MSHAAEWITLGVSVINLLALRVGAGAVKLCVTLERRLTRIETIMESKT